MYTPVLVQSDRNNELYYQKVNTYTLGKHSQIFGYFPFRYDQVPSDRILRKRFYLASLQATDRAVHFARLPPRKTISRNV